MNELKEKLTKEDCYKILDFYKTWNTSQDCGDEKEREIYHTRRSLILKVTKRLEELS